MLSLRELLSTQCAWDHLCGRQLFSHLGALISPHEQQLSSSSSNSTAVQSSLSSSALASSEVNKVSTSTLGTFHFHLLMVDFVFFLSVWQLCAVWAGIRDVFLFITILSGVETFSSDEGLYYESSSWHNMFKVFSTLKKSCICVTKSKNWLFLCQVAEAQTFCKSSFIGYICIICLSISTVASLMVLIFRCCSCQIVFQISRNCSQSHVRAHLHMNVTFFSLCCVEAALLSWLHLWVMCRLFWCCWNTCQNLIIAMSRSLLLHGCSFLFAF